MVVSAWVRLHALWVEHMDREREPQKGHGVVRGPQGAGYHSSAADTPCPSSEGDICVCSKYRCYVHLCAENPKRVRGVLGNILATVLEV